MTDPHPHTIGPALGDALERIVFSDPSTQALRAEWEDTKRREQEVFERLCAEEYAHRRKYHLLCRTPNPEQMAREEVEIQKQLYQEELTERLGMIWSRILIRVSRVLDDMEAEREGE